MGEADHRHLRRHHRAWRVGGLLEGFEQHLPGPGERGHPESLGHLHAARALVGADGGIVGGFGGYLDHADPVGDVRKVAQHRHRLRAVGVLRREFGERRRRVALHDQIEQIQRPAAVGQPQHGADLLQGRRAAAMADGLVEKRGRVARRPLRRPRNQRKRVVGHGGPLGFGDSAQHLDHPLRGDPPEVESLAAAQHGDGHLADLGGREDELHVLGRLLEGLQQRVEGAGREHVDFVDDVDLVAGGGGAVGDAVDDLADVADAGARGRVHLEHVDMAALGDGDAVLAHSARFGGRPSGAVGADAVHALGDDPRRGGLSDAAYSGHDEGVRDPVRLEGVFQRAHHRVLSDQVGEGLRAVLARQNLVGWGGGIVHRRPSGHGTGVRRQRRCAEVRDWTATQADSLRLLPSGPDRVGETHVRASLSEPNMAPRRAGRKGALSPSRARRRPDRPPAR